MLLNILENNVTVYQKHDSHSPQIAVLSVGTRIRQLKSVKRGDVIWRKIKLDRKTIGYISGVHVYKIRTIKLKNASCRIYSQPKESHKLDSIKFGHNFLLILNTIYSNNKEWYQIEAKSGEIYYILSSVKYSEINHYDPNTDNYASSLYTFAMCFIIGYSSSYFGIFKPGTIFDHLLLVCGIFLFSYLASIFRKWRYTRFAK